MAYLTQEQVREILQKAPPNLDKTKLIQELSKTNTLQGFNEQPQKQDGILKSIIKDPIKELIVRPAVRTSQAGIALFGGEKGKQFAQQDQNVNLPILGNFNIPSQKTGLEGAKQIGGDALKSASYLYAPGAASSAVEIGLTGAIKQTALQGAKVGLISTGMYSTGQALQDNKSAGQIAQEGIKGAITGGTTGLILGGFTGAAVHGLQNGLTNIKNKAAQSTIQKYNELFTGTKAGKTLLEKSQQQGKTPSKFLVEHNFIVDIEEGKVNATPTIEKIQSQAQEYDNVLDEILKVKDETIGSQPVSLQELGQKVKQKIASNPQAKASGYLNQQLNLVDNIIEDLTSQYGDSVNLQTLNRIKQAQWKQSSVFDATRPNFTKDIHYNFGSIAKQTIEDLVDQADVRKLNAYIGDHYNAIKNLQRLDGKAVRGGRLGNYFGRVVGAVAGSKAGPVGSMIGAKVGDSISTIMQNNYLSNPIKKIILARIPQESPLFAEVQKALQILQKQSIDKTSKASVMATKYGLPAQSTIFAKGADKTAIKVTTTPRPRNPRMLPAQSTIFAEGADKTSMKVTTNPKGTTTMGKAMELGKEFINGVKSQTPGNYTNSKYSIQYKINGKNKTLTNLDRDLAKNWAKWLKEKGLKFTIKTSW